MTSMKPSLGRLIAFVFVFTLSLTAGAASVIQVKGNRALLVLQGLPAQPGTELFALDAQQKRRAVLRVLQVKGDRAIAQITKGAASPGMLLIIRQSRPSARPPQDNMFVQEAVPDRYSTQKRLTKAWGILGGMAMSTMSLTAKTPLIEESLTMKGNSFNVKGFFDYPFSQSFNLRFVTGLETIGVSGTSQNLDVCSGSTTCSLSLNYLTLEGDAQLNLMNSSSMRFYLTGGFGFLLAMSKANNITNLEATGTNQVLLLGAGVDIKMGRTSFIPIVFEYGMFPFAGLSLSSMYLRAGYGMAF